MRFEMRYVEWVDSAGIGLWHQLSRSRKAALDSISTVGFVVQETDEKITLIQSFSNCEDEADDQADNAITIPKVAITKMLPVPEP